jgi:hypothetical protein
MKEHLYISFNHSKVIASSSFIILADAHCKNNKTIQESYKAIKRCSIVSGYTNLIIARTITVIDIEADLALVHTYINQM